MRARHRVLNNAIWLSVVNFSGYIIPLLEVPILTRSLGADEYGKVVISVSIALVMSIFVEFGFNVSASRSIACAKSNEMKTIVGEILTAKILLSAIVGSFFLPLITFNVLDESLLIPTFLYFIAFAFSPFWFFQGIQEMVLPAIMNLAARALSIMMIFLFVESPADSVLAIYMLAAFGLINTIATTFLMLKKTKGLKFSLVGAKEKIREGWFSFIYRSSGDLIGVSSPLILGGLIGSHAVGLYTPAEKIVRAMSSLQTPVLMAFFPYFSKNVKETTREAWRLVFFVMISSSLVCLVIWFFIPEIIVLFVGNGFEETIKLASFFVFVIPFRMSSQAIVMSIILPARMDKIVGYASMIFVVWILTAGCSFSLISGAIGMVWTFLIGDSLMLTYLIYKARRIIN